MARLSEADWRSSAALKELAAEMLRTRKADIVGGRLPTLFGILLQRPRIAKALSALGEELRNNGILSDRIRELALLQVVRLNKCPLLWNVHLPHAFACGLKRESLYRPNRRWSS